MSNFRFDITSDTNLAAVLTVAFTWHHQASHWAIQFRREDGDGPDRLILFWSDPKDHVGTLKTHKPERFLNPVHDNSALELVAGWLKGLKDEAYGPKPDIDGSVRRGFHIYNESWGCIEGCPYAFMAVEPAWIEYHK